ncbi:AAA family ATPase [Pseudomonas sp. HK3]
MKPSLLAFTAHSGQFKDDIHAQVNHLCNDLNISEHNTFPASITQMSQYLATKPSPNILIVDLSEINLTTEIKLEDALHQLAEVCEPGTKVIIIGDEITLERYKQLLDIGIENYLTLPINYDVLLHSAKQCLGLASNLPKQHSKSIVITGLQGGVGSTTITAALAQKLAQLGSHSLIADIDTELGDLSLFWKKLNENEKDKFKKSAIPLQQLQEIGSIERIIQNLAPRLNYLAVDTTLNDDPSVFSNVRSKLATQATTVLWDIPKHHHLAKSLWLQADTCVWVLESSVSVLRHWNTIKQYLDHHNNKANNTRHIFVLNQTRKERSEQISINVLEQALQQSLIILPYAGQQALDSANLGQAELLLEGRLGQAIDDICANILTRSKKKIETRSPLRNFLRPLRKLKSNKVAV